MAVYDLVTGDIFVAFGTTTFSYPAGFHVIQVGNTLNFLGLATGTTPSGSSELTIAQSVSLTKHITLSASNFLSFQQQSGQPKNLATSNLLVMSQVGVKVLPNDVVQTFTISQSVLVVRGTVNTLTLSQSVVVNQVKLFNVQQTLSLIHGTVGIIDSNWQYVAVAEPALITDYDPSTLAIPPVPDFPLPTILIGGGNALSFDIVEYGDSDKIEHTRVSRRTIGEELIIFRDPVWPKTETLKFKLVDISASQGKALLNFIEETVAQQIKLSDYLGVRWIGVIINPETALVQTGRDQGCSGRYEIEIEFQGTQVGYTTSQSAANVLSFDSEPVGSLT